MFAGGIVGNGILAMNPDKIEAIHNWTTPSDATELRSFLGTTNYLKQFYDNYSNTSRVLTGLLKTGKSVGKDWNATHDEAFQTLKKGFMQYPILRLPDFEKPFVVVSDACMHSIAGLVSQEYEFNGKKILMPVSWFSRTLNKHEVNYPVRELKALAIVETFKKYEYLLLGSAFTVACKTDHNTLRQVQQGGELTNKRLARWQEYLGGFSYQIEYIPGKENYLSDGISRSLNGFGSVGLKKLTNRDDHLVIPSLSAVAAVYDNRFENLSYTDSTEFKEVWNLLSSRGEIDYLYEPSIRYFEKLGNKLFHKNADGSLSLCVPEGHRVKLDGFKSTLPLREAVIIECHDSPYMGHRGINKTSLQVSKLFYWNRLHDMVSKYVSSCKVCARAKASSRGDTTLLAPNEAPLGPMHSISIDFMAGLPDVRGISKVLVIVDRFSKKIFTIPTPDSISASDLLILLHDRIFREHGYPLEIISDRDTLFTSKIWTNLFKVVGTKLSHSYAYHQRFDGQTEVMNRVLKEVLRSYSNFEQTNWLDNLPDTVQCINNS